jgi:rubrerythrin
METPFHSAFRDARRRFLRATAGTTLSAAGLAMVSGIGARAAFASADGDHLRSDVAILNSAVAAEHEAVAAYQLGAESGLLSAAAAKTALAFQSHHKAHVDALAGAIRKLGGEAVESQRSYDFPIDRLGTERDVLEFAAGLERGAVTAYAGAIPRFDDRQLSLAAASILADEAMHWAVLRNVLGLDPVPGAFFS